MTKHCFVSLLMVLLSTPVLADKVVKSKQGRLALTVPDSFKDQKPGGEVWLHLADEKSSEELLLNEAPGSATLKNIEDFFFVNTSEKMLREEFDSRKISVGGSKAVLFEVTSSSLPSVQTVYVYVDRKNNPYSVIFNYLSPRNEKTVQSLLAILKSAKNL